MKDQKPLIRRTFLEERFEILIKKQKNGTASFTELTELDEIVNSTPAIRHSILEEMENKDDPKNDTGAKKVMLAMQKNPQGLSEKFTALVKRLLAFTPVLDACKIILT